MRILLVENDEAIQRTTSRHLVNSGFEVQATPSGQQAIDLLRADSDHSIGCAIVDLSLSDISGNQVIDWIQDQRPDISIVVSTGLRSFQPPRDVTILMKPYTLEELKQAVAPAPPHP